MLLFGAKRVECVQLAGATKTAGQTRQKWKAAEHSRTPKPRGVLVTPINPTGFGVRLCSAALDRNSQPGETVLTAPACEDAKKLTGSFSRTSSLLALWLRQPTA